MTDFLYHFNLWGWWEDLDDNGRSRMEKILSEAGVGLEGLVEFWVYPDRIVTVEYARDENGHHLIEGGVPVRVEEEYLRGS